MSRREQYMKTRKQKKADAIQKQKLENERDHKQQYVSQKKNEIFNKLVESTKRTEHLNKDINIHSFPDVNDDGKPVTSMFFNAKGMNDDDIAALVKHLRLVEEYEALP